MLWKLKSNISIIKLILRITIATKKRVVGSVYDQGGNLNGINKVKGTAFPIIIQRIPEAMDGSGEDIIKFEQGFDFVNSADVQLFANQ